MQNKTKQKSKRPYNLKIHFYFIKQLFEKVKENIKRNFETSE